MKHFQNIKTLEELKSAYKKLAFKYHPDICHEPNATEIMQEINNEYDQMFAMVNRTHKNFKGEYYTKDTNEMPNEFRDIIEKLIKLKGLVVDCCGSWLWISGDTFNHKNELREMGCQYCGAKKVWSYTREKHHHNQHVPLKIIKDLYGCTTYKSEEEQEETNEQLRLRASV